MNTHNSNPPAVGKYYEYLRYAGDFRRDAVVALRYITTITSENDPTGESYEYWNGCISRAVDSSQYWFDRAMLMAPYAERVLP